MRQWRAVALALSAAGAAATSLAVVLPACGDTLVLGAEPPDAGGLLLPPDSALPLFCGDGGVLMACPATDHCSDLTLDPANCGACGHACNDGCEAGVCTPTTVAVPNMGQVSYGVVAQAGAELLVQAIRANGTSFLVEIDTGTDAVLQTIELGQATPGRIAFDGAGIFVTEGPPAPNAVAMIGADGGVSVTTTQSTAPSGLAIDGTSVYFTTANSLFSTPRSAFSQGPAVPTNTKSGFTNAIAVAIDVNNAYVADEGTLSVLAVSRSTGAQTTLATGIQVADLALDEASIYIGGGSAVNVVASSGGTANPIVSGLESVQRIVLDGTNVYVADLHAIVVVSKLTGATLYLARSSQIGGLAVTDTSIYFSDLTRNTLSKLPK